MSVHRSLSYVNRLVLVAVVVFMAGVANRTSAQEGGASINVNLYACMAEMEVDTITAAIVQESCFLAEMFPPIDFTLSTADGTSTAYTSDAGVLNLADVPVGGEVTLAETIPEGVGEPIVMCEVMDAAGTVIVESMRVPLVNGNAIVVEPEAGQTLQCTWAHLVGGTTTGGADAAAVADDDAAGDAAATPAGGASVTVVVHGCAEDVVATTGAEYLEACTGNPVGLVAVGDFEDFYEADTTTGVAGENSVTIAGVPETDVTISFLRPQSANSLAVFCSDASVQDDPAAWTEPTVSGSFAVDLPITADETVVCHWFVTSGEAAGDAPGNMVEIRAWSCRPDTVAGDDSWSYYFGQCEEADTSTTFTLTGAAGEQPATLARGWSTWTGVGDTFSLQANMADPSSEVVIVCGSYIDNAVGITWPVATAGVMDGTFDTASGNIMTCDWFTMPAAATVGAPDALWVRYAA